MFHRVKPDMQQPSQEPEKMPAEDVKPEVKSEDAAEAKQGMQAPEEMAEKMPAQTEMQTETPEETPMQIEESNMNQNMPTEDVNAEQEAQASTSPYQRMAASAPSSNYTTSYTPASSYKAPVAEPVASMSDRRLTIGAGITMSGEIESCDYLLVEGTVEAALKGANMLEISESGTFYGTVEISEATVAGRFEGDITVHGRLLIRSGGVVTGTISYGELEVEAGAVIDGRLTPVAVAQPVEMKQPSPSAPPKAANQAKPLTNPAPKEEAQSSANNAEGELFSKAS